MSNLDIRQANVESPLPPAPNTTLDMTRIAPHSIEAEEAVLGAALIDPDAFPELVRRLRSDDFFLLKHNYVWDAMAAINGRGDTIDDLSIIAELKARRTLEGIGGPAFISRLMTNTPTSLNASTYAEIVKRGAIRRRLLAAAGTIAENAIDEIKEISEIAECAASAVREAVADVSNERGVMLADLMSTTLTRIEDRYNAQLEARRTGTRAVVGFPYGFIDLDQMITATDGELHLIGGRPSMGKSMLLAQMGVNLAKLPALQARGPVILFSLEMGNDSLADRFIASESGVNSEHIKNGDLSDAEWDKVMRATDSLADAQLMLWDKGAITIEEIERIARRTQREHGLGAVLIDYLQLVRLDPTPQTRKMEKHQIVDYVAERAKIMARDLNIPVIAAVQLSRECEKRTDKRPILSDLADSGGLEKHADVVAFLYRDAYYNENSDTPNRAELGIKKNRNGQTGTVMFYYDPFCVRFSNLRSEAIPQ